MSVDITSMSVDITSMSVDITSMSVDITSMSVDITSMSAQDSPVQHKTKNHITNRCLPQSGSDLCTMYILNDSNIIIIIIIIIAIPT
jgi:hypothetical protein